MNNLPAALAAAVSTFIAAHGLLVTDSAAMVGECERVSHALACHLRGMVAEVDEDGDETTARATVRPCPVRIADDSEGLAAGHVAVWCDWAGWEFMIDLTAAQFAAEKGWTGPRAWAV